MQTVQEKVPTSEAREMLPSKVSVLPTSESKTVSTTSSTMVPKYSECILLSDDGPPQADITYITECNYPSRRSFRTGAEFVPRMRPKYHTSLVRVDGAPDESVVYHERVELAYCMLMEKFSEAVYNFPYETKNTYTTTLTYSPSDLCRRYITSLELVPAWRATVRVTKNESCNGQATLLDTEVGRHQPSAMLNGAA